MSSEKSKIVPNTFQTPNTLVDDFMRYLTGNETKCYLVIVRKTLGWLKRRDRISLSQIMEFTGMSEGPARESMKELCRFGLVNRTAENDPNKNLGPEYELELDEMKISMAGLVARDEESKSAAQKRISQARAKLAEKNNPTQSTEPPPVEQTHPHSVPQSTQKPLSKAIKKEYTPPPDLQGLPISEYRKIPEIRLFMDATKWIPGSFVLETVCEFVHAGLTEKQIADAFKAWCARGYRAANVQGYLEWARDGIPPAKGNYGSKNNTASSPRPTIQEPSSADLDAARIVLAQRTQASAAPT